MPVRVYWFWSPNFKRCCFRVYLEQLQIVILFLIPDTTSLDEPLIKRNRLLRAGIVIEHGVSMFYITSCLLFNHWVLFVQCFSSFILLSHSLLWSNPNVHPVFSTIRYYAFWGFYTADSRHQNCLAVFACHKCIWLCQWSTGWNVNNCAIVGTVWINWRVYAGLFGRFRWTQVYLKSFYYLQQTYNKVMDTILLCIHLKCDEQISRQSILSVDFILNYARQNNKTRSTTNLVYLSKPIWNVPYCSSTWTVKEEDQ